MPVKAPAIAPALPLDVHGYADLTIVNTRVTPGGAMIYPYRGFLTQIETGLSLDIYKNPTGFINKFSVSGGIWNEYWSDPPVGSGNWQEMDWWLGFSVGFAQRWTFSFSHVQFKLPGGPTAFNYAFGLSYDDGGFGVLPIALNPFVNVFYNASGFTNIATGDNTYRVEIGMKPSVSLEKSAGIPLTLTFPTYLTVGPSDYFNRNDGTTNLCGSLGTSPCSLSSLGVFSTGIQARYSLTAVIPPRLGSWYVKAGVQYHHLFNDALLASQTLYGSATTYADAHRDVVVASTGIGFSF